MRNERIPGWWREGPRLTGENRDGMNGCVIDDGMIDLSNAGGNAD